MTDVPFVAADDGTRARRIVIVDYDPAWAQVAAHLTAALQAACGPQLARVEHIGSTSVPGLAAKPVIDLSPVVRDDTAGEACVRPIVAMGYESRGEYGVPGRRYFRGTDDESGLDVHLHLFPAGSTFLRRHLLLRDYLRAHPSEADAYAAVKRELATGTWRDGNEYAEAKSPFIMACLGRAESWAGRTGWTDG